MTLSKNINFFAHVKPVLDAAIEAQGAIYKLRDEKAAQHWRHEAYQFRRLCLADGNHAYDEIFLTLVGKEQNEVKIALRKQTGELVTLDGKTSIVVGRSVPIVEDELAKEAKELADELFDQEDLEL